MSIKRERYTLTLKSSDVLRVKRSHLVVAGENGDIFFPFTADTLIGARYAKIRYRLLALVDGEKTVEDIFNILKTEEGSGQLLLEDTLSSLQRLVEEKIVECMPKQNQSVDDRYDRQHVFMGSFAENGLGFSEDVQKKLSSARVVIVGIGGVGSHTLFSLLSMGIGHLTIVDGDQVAQSNLNRQLFYTSQDVGRNKIDVLKRCCPAYNPGLTYQFLHKTLKSTSDFTAIMTGCDLLIMTADSPRDKIFRWAHEGADRAKTAVLYSFGMILNTITLGPLYLPGRTACFQCFHPGAGYSYSPPDFKHVNQAYQHGSFVTHVAIAGQIMALEAAKHITGFLPCRLYNQILKVDLDDYSMTLRSAESGHCGWCDYNARSLQL